MRTIDDRYREDAQFRKLVDTFEHVIRAMEFTPSEIREAAMLAQMRYEMTSPRPVKFSPQLMAEIESMADFRSRYP